jgi:hypothetical protein
MTDRKYFAPTMHRKHFVGARHRYAPACPDASNSAASLFSYSIHSESPQEATACFCR